MTKDRDNWKNIANSKRAKITKEVVHPSHVYLPVKLKTSETFIVEILNGSSNVGTLQLVMLSDRLIMVAIHRGNTNKSSGEWNKGSGSHSGLGFGSGIMIDVDIPSYDGSFTLDFYLSGYWISKHIIQYLQQ